MLMMAGAASDDRIPAIGHQTMTLTCKGRANCLKLKEIRQTFRTIHRGQAF
jgi:hypothetical protein